MHRQQGSFQYLTIDQVNAVTAEALAEQHGVPLELAEPRDLPWLESQKARVILDWDFLPAEDRSRVLNSQTMQVVAVHGYNFPDSVVSFLARRGILQFKQLSPEMFASVKGLALAA